MKKYGVHRKYVVNLVESLLQAYKLTDKYKAEKAQMDQELKDFIIYGKPTTWFDDELVKEILEYQIK